MKKYILITLLSLTIVIGCKKDDTIKATPQPPLTDSAQTKATTASIISKTWGGTYVEGTAQPHIFLNFTNDKKIIGYAENLDSLKVGIGTYNQLDKYLGYYTVKDDSIFGKYRINEKGDSIDVKYKYYLEPQVVGAPPHTPIIKNFKFFNAVSTINLYLYESAWGNLFGTWSGKLNGEFPADLKLFLFHDGTLKLRSILIRLGSLEFLKGAYTFDIDLKKITISLETGYIFYAELSNDTLTSSNLFNGTFILKKTN